VAATGRFAQRRQRLPDLKAAVMADPGQATPPGIAGQADGRRRALIEWVRAREARSSHH